MTMKRTTGLLGLLSLALACNGGPAATSATDSDATETETGGETTGGQTTDDTTIDPTSTSSPGTTEGPATTDNTTESPTTTTDATTEDPTTGSPVDDDTIYDIQGDVIGEGSDVNVLGVYVTAVATFGFYAQEPDGGQLSGVWVYTDELAPILGMLSVGDEVDIVGTTAEFEGLTQIDVTGGSVTQTGDSGVTVPELRPLDELGDPVTAEPWEGVLVRVEGDLLEVVDEPGWDEYDVSDGLSTLRVDEQMFNPYDPDWADDFPNFGFGAAFTAIQGPLNYSADAFKIAPRDENDVEGYVAGPEPGLGVEEMAPGDLVVTEVMYDAGGCGDADCEWIEVYNNTGEEIDLKGLIIRDEGDDPNYQGLIQVKTVVGVDGYAWLARGTADTWGYESPPDAFYGGDPGWNNAAQGDRVILRNSTEIIDQTGKWSGQGNADDGMAWQLTMGPPDPLENDDPNNWCLAAEPFDPNGDMGSPGLANPEVCP